MLEAALAAKAAGTDVVVGYVEPHGRRETERMLETLEALPLQAVRYRGMVRQEFNLDAALQRHAEILLVDELAHSNLVEGEPAPRHAKRWQDIAELCGRGDQCLDDAQRPAPGKPERPDRADYWRPPARDDPGPRARRGR